MVAVLRITTNPDGKITSVTLTKSSGDREYDQSTVEAVERSNPLSELEGLPKATYKSRFSTFHLTFDPEDLGQNETSGTTDKGR
jgi:colicin import membrane protein